MHSWEQVGIYIWNNIRYLFYLVTPQETMKADIKDVPRYVVEIFPFFVLMGFIENVCLLIKRGRISRLNDNVASLSQGIFQECLRINVRSIEVIVYLFVYNNLRFFTLPWNSNYTWILCLVGVDLGFYWAHRLAHEVNFIWAIHQAHHSGEDFTMTSALRQAVLQPFTAWLTYIPLALAGVPPSIFLTHLQLSELYMFWIHTEVVTTLGPLEYILNTPSHHRVHHGRNPKYIDKNYAGLFIFWDFLFNTFEPEDLNDPPVYGLVHPVSSYNPFYLQYHHWLYMWNYARSLPSWKDRLLVPFMGPGWQPGKPRLGNYNEIPEVEQPVVYFDPPLSILGKAYVIVHFFLVLLFYHNLTLRVYELNQYLITIAVLSILYSITSIGFILENRLFAPFLEISRCICFIIWQATLLDVAEKEILEFGFELGQVSNFIQQCFVWSAIGWLVVIIVRCLIYLNQTRTILNFKNKFNKVFEIRKQKFKKVN